MLREHRRLGHLHDLVLKRMIDGGMCGNLVWVPGIVLRAHYWDCLKGQQKRNVPAPDLNIRELHPLSYQVLVWDWVGHSMFVLFTANYTGSWPCVLAVITGALSLPRNLILYLSCILFCVIFVAKLVMIVFALSNLMAVQNFGLNLLFKFIVSGNWIFL